MPVEERLNVKKTLDEMRALYHESDREGTFNALIIGNPGTGKTSLLTTCRMPVVIHSFDPGGTKLKVLKPLIDSGQVIPDTRFEVEDRPLPTAYKLWEKTFYAMRKSGIFAHIGTYCLDSCTSWAEAMMHQILKEHKGIPLTPRTLPKIEDWQVQKNTMRDEIMSMCALPCDFILMSHIDYDKDEGTGKILAAPMVTGNFKTKMPLLFDERYYMSVTGGKFQLQVHPSGLFDASTRMCGEDADTKMAPDIKALLKLAGKPCEDKEA